jgi:hypothetical protein
VVADPRAAGGAGRLRPLNRPRPLQVEANEGSKPIAVYLLGQRLAVEELLESWRIDDEWWRPKHIARAYWRVLLEDGRTLDVYRDLVSGRWAQQTYG